MNSKSNSANMTIGMIGFLLGGLGTAFYLISRDSKKQENIKEAISEVKNVTTRTLDTLRERISHEADETEDLLKDLRRNEDRLNV